MTPQATLDAVREISERALLRPAPTRLRLAKPEEEPGPRRAIIAYEDTCTPRIGSWTRPHQKASRRAPVAHVTQPAMEKDFMRTALDKAEAAVERRPMVIPAGQ